MAGSVFTGKYSHYESEHSRHKHIAREQVLLVFFKKMLTEEITGGKAQHREDFGAINTPSPFTNMNYFSRKEILNLLNF